MMLIGGIMQNKTLMKKAARAQLLSAAGISQSDIARDLGGVSTRTIRRWLTYEVPSEMMPTPSEVELASRAAFIDKAWPLVIDLVDFVESQLRAGELKARDAIVGAGILIDKIRALAPPAPVATEEEEIKFIFSSEQAKELTDGGGGQIADTESC
jgi:hypothetical protein